MNTKMESSTRQGQFPASFPDTFKDFFSVLNEEDDHVELFSNLLEDKVIPRSNKCKYRTDDHLTSTNATIPYGSDGTENIGGDIMTKSTTTIAPINVSNFGRSNSFRLLRKGSDYCKHMKYCCLHQNHYIHHHNPSYNQQQIHAIQQPATFGYHRPNQQLCDGDGGGGGGGGGGVRKTSSCNINCEMGGGLEQISGSGGGSSLTIYEPTATTTDNSGTTTTTSKLGGPFASNCSDDEKRMKKCAVLFKSKHLSGCKCDTCEDSDTISSCSSSNKTSSYSCLLRLGKPATYHGPTGTTNRSMLTISTSPLRMLPEISGNGVVLSNASTAPIDSTTATNQRFYFTLDNNGLVDKCGCQQSPSDYHKSAKSPVFNRRRASSIAATHISPEYRYMKGDDCWTGPTSGGLQADTAYIRDRYSHCKSPINSTSGMVSGTGTTTISAPKSPLITPSGIQPNNFGVISNEIGTGNGNVLTKQRTRMRTSSMPAENRKPRLAETRRAAIHCADMDLEYYRLRSFSITSHGICNLGDSMRSRRSRSINSVTSTGTSNSGTDRNNSVASQISMKDGTNVGGNEAVPAFKIAMLGEAGVGKTALTYQFTTSDYICAYDLSLDDDYGQKTVSVLLDGQETDLEIIDHPACEMSTEAFCSTYNIDLFVVVYSVVDKKSYKTAEKILHYLKESEMLWTRGAILVGNKTDLERHREVPSQAGRRLAKEVACKFIETSSGLDHNVNELLVGIVAQVKLNPLRIQNLTEKQKLSLNAATIQKHRKAMAGTHFVQKPKQSVDVMKSLSPASSSTTTTTTTLGTTTQSKYTSRDQMNDDDDGDSSIDDEYNMGGSDSVLVGKHGRYDRKHINRPSQFVYKGFNLLPTTNKSDHCQPTSPLRTRDELYRTDDGRDDAENERSIANRQNVKRDRINLYTNDIDTISGTSDLDSDVDDSNSKRTGRITNRTKMFVTSFLKFKRSLRVKRRNSNSCSDLFVI